MRAFSLGGKGVLGGERFRKRGGGKGEIYMGEKGTVALWGKSAFFGAWQSKASHWEGEVISGGGEITLFFYMPVSENSSRVGAEEILRKKKSWGVKNDKRREVDIGSFIRKGTVGVASVRGLASFQRR